MTISDILDYLDGRGIILTDDDLISEALSDLGLSSDTEVSAN